MFVVIAAPLAQADPAAAARALLGLRARFDGDYPLAPDAADSGDVRALTPSPRAALETVLHLARARQWRVGLGIGAVRTPLPATMRDASGSGVVAAHDALGAAARRASRCAIRGEGTSPVEPLEPLLDLLLAHRERWSEQGWQLHDLLEAGRTAAGGTQAGGTQADAAQTLGITPQAVSKRARAAGLRVDAEARTALTQLLGAALSSAALNSATRSSAALRPSA
ncbi:MAG: DNA-binding protein [Microcella pacifica]|uniref:DNA-binding protein n=1 Tax=Microcella pacifica TaxID=2591847 RepID=UPI003315066A